MTLLIPFDESCWASTVETAALPIIRLSTDNSKLGILVSISSRQNGPAEELRRRLTIIGAHESFEENSFGFEKKQACENKKNDSVQAHQVLLQ